MKVLKSIIFLVESLLGNFKDIWQFFSGHTDRSTRFVRLFQHVKYNIESKHSKALFKLKRPLVANDNYMLRG